MSKETSKPQAIIKTEETPVTERLITRFRQQVDQDNRQRIDNMSPDEARQKLSRYFQETK